MSTSAGQHVVSAPATTPPAEARPLPPRPRVTLGGVSWATYLALRAAEENAHVRMTYRSGTLDLMTTSRRHEFEGEVLRRLLWAWAYHKRRPLAPLGSATLRDDELGVGVEPDASYQFRPGEPDGSLPPDLAIEIDLTTDSRPKLALYHSLGVPEVWLYDGTRLEIDIRTEEGYQVVAESAGLPGFPVAEIPRWIAMARSLDSTTLTEQFLDSAAETEGD